MAFLTQGSMQLGADTFSEIHPKRFALQFNNPAIVLEYLVPSTGKLYHHKMKLRPEDLDQTPDYIYQMLRRKHPTYLDPRKVSDQQVIELIRKLQARSQEDEIIL